MQRVIPAAAAGLLLVNLSLAGCEAPDPAPPPAEVSRPVEILEIQATALGSGLRFPGRVRAVQRAELAFNVPGRIIEFPAREGETRAAGALIARLDPTEYALRLDAARAQFDKARTDFERVLRIWEQSQAIARAEVDQQRTAMEVARSAFAAASKDLEDTRLTAPFAGVIARRFVENFQNVQAKQAIVSLQDDALEIVIHVPERVVRSEPKRLAAFATFEDVPDRRFAVTVKSFATEADPQTQTFAVVLALPRPEDVTVLPGMAADVFPDLAATTSAVQIPLDAVVASPDGTPFVWLVDAQSSRVSRRPVTVGQTDADQIEIVSGLAAGDRIAVSGVHHLRDAMLVRPL